LLYEVTKFGIFRDTCHCGLTADIIKLAIAPLHKPLNPPVKGYEKVTYMRVLFATPFNLGLITVDFHRGYRNIDVRNTFRKRSYDIKGIVLVTA